MDYLYLIIGILLILLGILLISYYSFYLNKKERKEGLTINLAVAGYGAIIIGVGFIIREFKK